MPARSSARRPACTRRARRRSSRSANCALLTNLRSMARRYFGTDGVRGIAGEFLTVDLVERLGRAAVIWHGGERVFVGRDTRASGIEFEAALAEGIASAGATAILGGV